MKGYKLNKLFVAMLLSAAVAVPAYAGQSMLTTQKGGVFVMPTGASRFAASASPSDPQEIRTRIPIGDKRLADLKFQSEVLGFKNDKIEVVEVPLKGNSVTAPESRAPSNGIIPQFVAATCTTNSATGYAPSDIHGAAGPSRLVVVTNVDIGVYDKSTCITISNVSLKSLFGAFEIPDTETLFDPRVLYDNSVGRFFVTAESTVTGNTDQYQYFAVSQDSTATAWWIYRIPLSVGPAFFCKKAADSFWDYPQSGKSSRRWFITANDFPTAEVETLVGSAGVSATGAVLAIDKWPTLTGQPARAVCFSDRAFNTAAPIVLDSSTKSVFLAPTPTRILRSNYTEGANISLDKFVAATPYAIIPWQTPPNAVQPNGQMLDSLDGRFQSASIQTDDQLWNIHTVNYNGRPLIRWYRLQNSVSKVLSTVTFASTATSHLFNPSIVTSPLPKGRNGEPAFITASRTDPTVFCEGTECNGNNGMASMITLSGPNNNSSFWTQSLAGVSTDQFTLCNIAPRGSCRWGDYSSITVDPNDAHSAWGFNQLISGPSMWNWTTLAAKETNTP